MAGERRGLQQLGRRATGRRVSLEIMIRCDENEFGFSQELSHEFGFEMSNNQEMFAAKTRSRGDRQSG